MIDYDEDEQDPVSKELICSSCGGLNNAPEVDARLWDLYYRLKSGVQNYEPLVFDGEWMQENIMDEEDHDAMMNAMGRDMHNRGLCPTCGRPDLRGKREDDFHTEEDLKEMQDLWAMEAAERRAGC